jgi:hypothetical protein
MFHARLQRTGSLGLVLGLMIVTVCLGAVMASTASAENPLYCSEFANINQGCQGPTTLIHVNEARNENSGCIAVQIWASGIGYSEPFEMCGGNVAAQELTIKRESFPKCWNRTNALDIIHCRYSAYGI